MVAAMCCMEWTERDSISGLSVNSSHLALSTGQRHFILESFGDRDSDAEMDAEEDTEGSSSSIRIYDLRWDSFPAGEKKMQ